MYLYIVMPNKLMTTDKQFFFHVIEKKLAFREEIWPVTSPICHVINILNN